MILEVGVKALIKNTAGKYLLLLRAAPYPGDDKCRWDVPGGRINPGEELVIALKREIEEETGLIMVDSPQIIYAQDILRVIGKHTVRLTYIAKVKGKVRLDPVEHQDYVWFSIGEIKKMNYDKYLTPVLKLV